MPKSFRVKKGKYKIRKLDNQLKPVFHVEPPLFTSPHTIIHVGPKGKGKTTTIVNMLLNRNMYRKKFNAVFGFIPTYDSDKKWKKIRFRRENLYINAGEPEVQDAIEKVQDGLALDDKYQSLFIFDDKISDRDLFNNDRNNIMNYVYYNLRHLNLSLWVCSQKFTNVPTGLRENIDGIVIYQQDNQRSLHQIWSEFVGDMNFKDFMELYEFCVPDDHSFMFISTHKTNMQSGKYSKQFDIIESMPSSPSELASRNVEVE